MRIVTLEEHCTIPSLIRRIPPGRIARRRFPPPDAPWSPARRNEAVQARAGLAFRDGHPHPAPRAVGRARPPPEAAARDRPHGRGPAGDARPLRPDVRCRRIRFLPRGISQTILEQVHVSLGGMLTVPPFLTLLATFGADRIMFSVDYPFIETTGPDAFLERLPIPPAIREKIAYRNADRVLKRSPDL